MKHNPDLEKYLKEASSWEADRLRDSYKQNIFLRWVIVGLLAIVGSMAWAIKGLTPLKTKEPYVIRVDNSTGIVDVVPIYTGEAGVQEQVTRTSLSHYQTVREQFYYTTAETDYETVGAFNSPALNSEWGELWAEANPESPLVKYKDGTTVRVHIKGISFLEPDSGAKDIAQIRFTTEKRQGGTGAPQITHWLSTIKYAYGPPSKIDKDRAINPMGLRIISYRKEPEVIQERRPGGEQ